MIRVAPGFVRRVLVNYVDHGCTVSAAAVSYYTLLTSVPLILAAIAGLGYALGSSDSAFRGIVGAVARVAPGTERTLEEVLQTVIRQKGGVGAIALVSFLWTGSAVFGVLERAMDTAWHVERRRGLVRSKLHGTMLVLLSGMGLLASTFLAYVVTLHARGLAALGIINPAWVHGLWRHVTLGTQFVLSACAFTLLLAVVPNIRVPARRAIQGGVLTAVLWETSKYLFALYVTRLAPYRGTYGPIGGVVVLVVWMYYSASIVLFGAEVTALLAARESAGGARLSPVPADEAGSVARVAST